MKPEHRELVLRAVERLPDIFPIGKILVNSARPPQLSSRTGRKLVATEGVYAYLPEREVIGFQMQSDAIHNAVEFGRAVQRKRKALGMTQRDLALAVGVGERFVVDLEKGKPTCELGRALRVAAGVGFRLIDAASAEDLGATQDVVPGFEA